MKRLSVGVTLLLLGMGALARAGYQSPPLLVSVTSTEAWGQTGDARNSADSTQFIGCMFQSDDVSILAECHAVDAAGKSVHCYTSSPSMISAVASANSDAFIGFAFDPSTAACTQVLVFNLSYQRPKTP